MRVGIWGNDCASVQPRRAQCGVLGRFEPEVHKAVVDQVDTLAISMQSTGLTMELGRGQDNGVDAALLQQLSSQPELRILVLFLRLLIDDRDAGRTTTTALGAPFTLELSDDREIESLGPRFIGCSATTLPLGSGQYGVEKRAPALVLTSISRGPSAPRGKS